MALPTTNLPQRSIIRGDSTSLSIAASAIVAKVERDALLTVLDDTYPGYGFASHKGYGTQTHIESLARMGPCPIHRMTFRPLSQARIANAMVDTATAGTWAESFAAQAMEERGIALVDRNYRTRFGEVDLIATEGSTLVFVEVRARQIGGLRESSRKRFAFQSQAVDCSLSGIPSDDGNRVVRLEN